MFIVFPLVTFMDYGQIKYFKIEKLKLFPSFVFKELFNSLQLQKTTIWNVSISGEDDLCYDLSVPQKMRQICVDFLMCYL